jgi:calcineurin-like phosphoesterase family protein
VKILIAGDTHGDLGQLQYLVKEAKKRGCDRVFVLGDFGYWEHAPEGRQFLDRLDTYANLNNIHVYFCDGNHDKTSLLLKKYSGNEDPEGFLLVRPYVHYAGRGHRWTWDHVAFIALGGAYSVDKAYRLELEASKETKYKAGDLWFPEEEMSDEDMAKILLDSTPVDIIVAHDKPRGSNPGWNRKGWIECLPNQDRLQLAVQALSPQLYFHGHLHWWYKEEMRHSTLDGTVMETTVYGLSCEPASNQWPGYERQHSWHVLDTLDIVPRSFLA